MNDINKSLGNSNQREPLTIDQMFDFLVGKIDKIDTLIDTVNTLVEDVRSLKEDVRTLKRKAEDNETRLYGMRALQGGGYYPPPEQLQATGGASIEPVAAWRRRIS